MFNNYKEQFAKEEARKAALAKEQEANRVPINPVMVGSASTLIVGINPTQEQLTEIIGDVAERFDTKYSKTADQYNDNKMSQPVTFWLTDKKCSVNPTIQTIRLVDTPRTFSTGNKQWFALRNGTDKNGNPYSMLVTTWGKNREVGQVSEHIGKTSGQPYIDKILSQVRVGEENYYDLLKVITKWSDMSNFLEGMKSEGLDFDTVYEGDFDGLHNLVNNFINGTKVVPVLDENGTLTNEVETVDNLQTFIGIFTAKIKENGKVVQAFSMNPTTWFPDNYGALTKGMRTTIEKARKERLNRDGKDIIAGAYTLDPLTEYNEDAVKQEFPTVNPDDFDFDFTK